MSFLINSGIPEGDLPVKTPSAASNIRYVEGGKSYSSPMPDIVTATEQMQAAIDGVVADAVSEIGVVVNGIGYLPPVAFTSGLNVDSSRFTVTYGGVTYAPIADSIPFTTTGTFNPSQWRVVQGVTAADLGAPSGSTTVGFLQSGVGAVPRTLEKKVREIRSVTDYMTEVERADAASGTPSLNHSTAIQAAIDATYTAGGGSVTVPRGVYRIGAQVTIKSGVDILLDHGAVIIHGASTSLFRVKPRSRFIGGRVDTSSTSIATFTGVVFDFDGSDTSPNFKGIEPTCVTTELKGVRGSGAGTAFILRADSGPSANVYGVQIDAYIDGFETGVHLKKSGASADFWVNGNSIKVRGIATVNLVKMTNDTDGFGIDANDFHIEYQTILPHTSTVIDNKGRFNRFHGMVWDFNSGTAVSCSVGSNRNLFEVGGLMASTFADAGAANTLMLFTQTNPGLKVVSLLPNSSATLPIDSMDLVLSNNKSLQWKDSGGTQRTILQLSSANNVTLQTAPASGQLLLNGFMRQVFQIGGSDRMRLESTSVANDTALLIWDVNHGSLQRVTVGAADSGGVGFRLLRIPN